MRNAKARITLTFGLVGHDGSCLRENFPDDGARRWFVVRKNGIFTFSLYLPKMPLNPAKKGRVSRATKKRMQYFLHTP